MSRSVDLFIDVDLPLDRLAEELGRLTGLHLTPEPHGDCFVLSEGRVVARLAEHPYGDDEDLPLSRHRYALSSRVPDDDRLQDSEEAVLLRRVSQQLRSGSPWRALLVLDLQYRDPGTPGDWPGTAGEGEGI